MTRGRRYVLGVAAALGVSLALAAREHGNQSVDATAATWRSGCPARDRPAPLSLEAARAAHRLAERRQTLRTREADAPGSVLRDLRTILDPARLAAGELCPAQVADLGGIVFEHEYGFADGLGGGAAAKSPMGPFRRVHGGLFGGPETISCASCHWVGGPNGAGAETDDAFLNGDGALIASGDARNPQALVALGVVQSLGREMSDDLQRQRGELVRDATRAGSGREIPLRAKGIDFGILRANARGEVDTSAVHGVDGDLVVKPFGWKGTLPAIADFASDALQMHLGIQNASRLVNDDVAAYGHGTDPADRDEDGVRDELGRGPFTAMVVHLALLELPVIEPLVQTRQLDAAAKGLLPPTTRSFTDDFQRGRRQFRALGCADCHVPMLVLTNPVVDVDGVPPIDLSREMHDPPLTYDAAVGGYPVWLFSDLKRHDMGVANAARHIQRGVAPNEYLTPRLWAVANSAPYLHDGRAPSFDYAIAGHDGEGAAARAAFAALSMEDKGALRVYLASLRRAPRVIVP